jgi:hypothetical protein
MVHYRARAIRPVLQISLGVTEILNKRTSLRLTAEAHIGQHQLKIDFGDVSWQH